MLGSNDQTKINIELAIHKLAEHVEIISRSSQIKTEPYGGSYSADFQNMALKIVSAGTRDETIALFKQIEVEMGRKPDSKRNGIIPIDIDLIFWNDELVHDDYRRCEYVRKSIKEIK